MFKGDELAHSVIGTQPARQAAKNKGQVLAARQAGHAYLPEGTVLDSTGVSLSPRQPVTPTRKGAASSSS